MTDVLDALSYAAPSPFADVIFLDLEALVADGFEEEQHPRDEHGHFIDTSKEDKPLEAHSRNELIDRLRSAGYTGPTSYTKDKLQEIVRQHEATAPTPSAESASPAAETQSPGDVIPGEQLREFVEPLSLSGAPYGDAAGKTVFAVATANGGQVHLFIDEDVAKGGRPTPEEAQLMLSTVADLHDRYGEGKDAPSIAIVSRETADSVTNGMGMATKAYVGNTYGINIVGQNIRKAEASKTWFMPSSRTLDPIRSTTMHEYGHVHDMFIRSYRPADERGPTRDAMFRQVVGAGTKSIVKETSTGLPNAGGISKYGQTNAYEAYAEAFQEYVGTGGTSDLPAVQAYAEAYGWNK